MKQFYLKCLFFIISPVLLFSQSIFENSITGINPNEANPYTIGQIVDPNISVSGIGMGNGIFGINTNDRYNARSWSLFGLDSNSYFEFTIAPNAGKKIDFVSFEYTGQISDNGPTAFAFRSSVDGFGSDIGLVTATGTTVSLSSAAFQDIVVPITFRLYGWASGAGTGTFSINNFKFNGFVSCITPQAPTLPQTSLGCTATSFVLNWLAVPNATNYYIDIATDSAFTNYLAVYQNKALGNILTETVTGLIAGGTYYVRLKATSDCLESDYSNSIKVAPSETVYNGSWSNGEPDTNTNVRFSNDYNLSGSLEVCSCQIDTGVIVSVDSDGVLKLQNGLEVQDGGSLIFENNSALIQVNDDAVNTGQIIYRRITAPMKNFDFTYWASPVKNQTLKDLSPNTFWDKYYSFNNGAWKVEAYGNSLMEPAKGYIIRVPKPNVTYPNDEFWNTPTYAQPVEFVGVPNNGKITIPTQGEGMNNLIGNPYPSALDAKLFMANLNNALVIDGALHFWTHNTPITKDGASYVYSSNDYALYNLTGGTLAQSGGKIPDGTIAAGQSFFVKSKGDGNFEFNNSMRISDLNSNSQFFKKANAKSPEKAEKNRAWLSLSNNQGAFKQLLIGYLKGATNGIDNLYDGLSYDSNKYIDFYSVNGESNFAIQGRSLPFLPIDKVPLGYKTTIEGTFEIKIDQADGLLMKHNIYLEDKNLGILHDLKKGAYSFVTSKGQYDNRFVLRYLPNLKGEMGQEIAEKTKQQLEIYAEGKQLNIKSKMGKITAVFIYDLKGQLLYQKTKIDKVQFEVTDLIPKHQLLIVKTVFENNCSQTDKVIF